jgi:hypothetical protein
MAHTDELGGGGVALEPAFKALTPPCESEARRKTAGGAPLKLQNDGQEPTTP